MQFGSGSYLHGRHHDGYLDDRVLQWPVLAAQADRAGARPSVSAGCHRRARGHGPQPGELGARNGVNRILFYSRLSRRLPSTYGHRDTGQERYQAAAGGKEKQASKLAIGAPHSQCRCHTKPSARDDHRQARHLRRRTSGTLRTGAATPRLAWSASFTS